MKKKLLCLCTALLLTVGCLTDGQPAYAADNVDGLSFAADTYYRTEKAYSAEITTYEATINLPASMTSRAGVILGNYKDGNNSCYSFEIDTDGNPRLMVLSETGTVMNYVFRSVDATRGEWTHVAIVRDKANKEVRCYLNGTLGGTLKMSDAEKVTVVPRNVAVAGGDLREGNGRYFQGSIRDITLYADVRTAGEIATDARGTTSLDKDALIAAYQFKSSDASADRVADRGANQYHLKRTSKWMNKGPKITSYDYSFAVVGDTQIVNRDYNGKMETIYDYICNNVSAKKTKFVFNMGDITDRDSAKEWEMAKKQIHKMDNLVGYSLLRGNHDSVGYINKYFPTAAYQGVLAGSYGDSITDTYQTFSVGNLDYLVLCLDFGPSDAVLEWAAEVVEDHPHHNVIVTTHSYLNSDGTTVDRFDPDAAAEFHGINDGDQIWDKLVKRYSNIVLVLSGHVSSDEVVLTETKGVHGNTVRQILVDHQGVDAYTSGGAGIVCNFYFSNGGKNVQVETYSTIRNQWFMEENQFSFTLDVVPRDPNAKSENGLQMEQGIANKPWKVPEDAEAGESEDEITALNGVKIPVGTYSKSITVGAVEDDAQGTEKNHEFLVPMIIIGASTVGLATLGIVLYIMKKKGAKSTV